MNIEPVLCVLVGNLRYSWDILVKRNKTVQKPLNVKLITFKIIFINRNTKTTKFGVTYLSKCRCRGNVKFLDTAAYPTKLFPDKFKINSQSLSAFN